MSLSKFYFAVNQRLQQTHSQNPTNNSRRHHHDIVRAPVPSVLAPKNNKGLNFTMEERQRLHVHGLFPAAFRTMQEQVFAVAANFHARATNIGRYRYLRSLRQRHERLYFRFLSEHLEDVLPVIYTPTVGVACTIFGMIFRGPMGMYVTKYDRGHVAQVLRNWPESDIRAVCVTDGERILGLGDLGANGMGITVGKLELYTALSCVPPHQLLPVCLDVGTNNEELLADPMYIGTRDRRIRGREYDEFVDEFMQAVVEIWGQRTLIHFEDFATPNAFMLLERYQHKYCCFNDDIQGTAAVGLAGLLAVERITKKKLPDHVIVFAGAGSAAMGVASLLTKELKTRQLDMERIVKNIYVFDHNGLIVKSRKDVAPPIQPYAKDMPHIKALDELVEKVKPSILLGATSIAGLFSEKILRFMGANNERPAIFAFSNPTSKAECTAEQAYAFTEGRALFSAGSPFPPVVVNGKRMTPGQANNCFAFPGIGLGVLTANAKTIPDEIFLMAAHTLAQYPEEDAIDSGRLYPKATEAKDVALTVAVAVAQYLFDNDLGQVHPVPENICKFIVENLYELCNGDSLVEPWKYPDLPRVPFTKDYKIPPEDVKISF
ncbi:NADP-dependent malic enzyme-like isoform X1 [Drosophila subobscura]|uniref:NADP-dependent malic enzyme-like isoform X1 n=1 Tax=Drosophila subobscura TaxID=7241 RepID=UPI00155B0845|nr:NADP-dependent malic enzyme-like isoform X1 [Drosophila subobscura]